MKQIIKLDEQVVNYLESLRYDYSSYIDLILVMLNNNKAKELNLEKYEKLMLEKYIEYRCAADELLKIYNIKDNYYN